MAPSNQTFLKLDIWQYVFTTCLVLLSVCIIRGHMPNLANAPVSRFSPPVFGGWLEACRFVYESHVVIGNKIQKEGANGQSFQVSTPSRLVVVTTNPRVLKELGSADESLLSMQAAANERNSTEYILCSSIHNDPYHVEIISKKLTSRIEMLLPAIVEEVCLTFRENSSIGSNWTPIHGLDGLLSRCVSAATNRVLVGMPLCRDKEYLDCLVQLSHRVSRAGLLCGLTPRVLRSLVAKLLVHQSQALKTFLSKVGPLIEQRRSTVAGRKDKSDEMPDDAVQWICEAALPSDPLYELCFRILYVNFSAIHTTSVSITQAVYDLAAHREFQGPIRDEIKCVLKNSSGWTRHALAKMQKLDSSLKESQRLHPVTTATMMRKAQRPCTLSDGTYLARGRWVVVPAYSINHSAQWHTQPETFDAFRFSRLAEQDGQATRHGLAYPEKGFLSFGIGKHACPGRFFAAAELKVLLAYIICNYDFKFSDGKRPKNKFFSFSCLPDFRAPLLLRKIIDSSNPFSGHDGGGYDLA